MKIFILIFLVFNFLQLVHGQVFPSSLNSPFAGPPTLQTPKQRLSLLSNLGYPQLNWGANPAATAACPMVEHIAMYNITCDAFSFIWIGFEWANSTNATESAIGYELLDTVFAFLDQGFAVGPNNDVWGYDDPSFGNAYALVCAGNGLSVVDVTVPQSPRIIGFFQGPYSLWRDAKSRGAYAYYVQDAFNSVCLDVYTGVNRSYCDKLTPTDGLSIVDLSRADSPVLVKHDTTYFSYAHNLFVEVDAGRPYAYACGGDVTAVGGVAVFDLSDPINPKRIAQWDEVYLHDVMVQRRQSDGKYLLYGAAIMEDVGDDQLFVFDVDDPTHPVVIGKPGRSKWGWLHNENGFPITIWDASDLENLHEVGELWLTHNNDDISAHNVHIRGDRLFISFYSMGTVVYDISKPRSPVLLAQYDTYPQNWQNSGSLEGNWGVYPFAASRLPNDEYYIYSNDMSNGLFVTKLSDFPQPAAATTNLNWFIGVSFALFFCAFVALAYLLYLHFTKSSEYSRLRD